MYTLGYAKLPGLRDASVTMQQGAVTNESVTSLAKESLFLYSAISRPGNSGGPVMSEDGYFVGLSIVNATGQYHTEDAFSPHYAGIPAQVLVKAVEDLSLASSCPVFPSLREANRQERLWGAYRACSDDGSSGGERDSDARGT